MPAKMRPDYEQPFPGFGARIEERIRILGFKNTSEFARERRVDKSNLYRWVAGHVPERANLLLLERELQVPWQWLIVGDDGLDTLDAFKDGRWRPPSAESRRRHSG